MLHYFIIWYFQVCFQVLQQVGMILRSSLKKVLSKNIYLSLIVILFKKNLNII